MLLEYLLTYLAGSYSAAIKKRVVCCFSNHAHLSPFPEPSRAMEANLDVSAFLGHPSLAYWQQLGLVSHTATAKTHNTNNSDNLTRAVFMRMSGGLICVINFAWLQRSDS